MALKIDAKYERKLTCALKNDMRNLANMHRLNKSMATLTKLFTNV